MCFFNPNLQKIRKKNDEPTLKNVDFGPKNDPFSHFGHKNFPQKMCLLNATSYKKQKKSNEPVL